VDEEAPPSDPTEHVLNLSRRKAEDVARRLNRGIVLGADTIVVVDGEILGKPRNPQEARRMLRLLAGRTHMVLTGLTLIDLSRQRSLSDSVVTVVRMRPLSRREIDWYVSTGEPMDKAGSYGIQGKGSILIERIEGCFYNVVGLPLAKLAQMLQTMGYACWMKQHGPLRRETSSYV
jgi:septum formation protein